jgi:hypothetical protein
MSIKKVGMNWYSDLLPNAVFESHTEAAHYDREQALRQNASQGQLEDALKNLPQADLEKLVKATMTIVADSDTETQRERQGVINEFLSQTPELIQTGEKGLHNRSMIMGFLHAKGCLQPSIYDLRRAYEDLKSMKDLYVKR